MRARAFLLGALCAATITALTIEAMQAHADHTAPSTPVAVDRVATLSALADLQLQIDEAARLASTGDKSSRKKLLRRLAIARSQVDGLAAAVDRAPAARPDDRRDDDRRYDDRDDRRGDRDRDRDRYDDDRDHRRGDDGRHACSDRGFQSFLQSVAGARYASDQLALVQQYGRQMWFTAAQVGQIVDQFTYSTDKVEAAVALWPRIVDPQNAYTVYDHLPYSTDRDTVRQRVK